MGSVVQFTSNQVIHNQVIEAVILSTHIHVMLILSEKVKKVTFFAQKRAFLPVTFAQIIQFTSNQVIHNQGIEAVIVSTHMCLF